MTARTTKLKKQNINSNNNKNDIQPNQSDNNKNQNSNDNTVDKLNPQEKNDIPNYTLEPEPEEKNPNATAIRVRLPNGSTVQRRFKKDAKIEELYKWISMHENKKNITLVQTVPRMALNDKKDQTLQQTGLIRALLNCSHD